MLNKKRNKFSCLPAIIGTLFIIIGTSFIIFDIYEDKNVAKVEEQAIDTFYEKEMIIENSQLETEKETVTKETKQKNKLEYIGVLKIPKIKLERGLVSPNSYLNNVDYNIEILDSSDMPDVINGNLILAAHSGNSRISYFKNLDKLKEGDKVVIDYKGKSYNYVIVNIYEILRTGKAEIVRNVNINTLTLITCKDKTNKQIVIICELENI